MPVQLSLRVKPRDEPTFENFYSTPKNQLALKALRSLAKVEGRAQHHLLWGNAGAGISHMLAALCHEAGLRGSSAHYLPLGDLQCYPPEDVLEGLERTQLLCLDDLEQIAGKAAWEKALFHLFNRTRDRGNILIFGSHASPQTLAITLPDLKSRILGCPVYHLFGLTDSEKQAALVMRAEVRGLRMSAVVARFILNHCPRNMGDLIGVLDRLDDRSLEQQRKLTIPFVKAALQQP